MPSLKKKIIIIIIENTKKITVSIAIEFLPGALALLKKLLRYACDSTLLILYSDTWKDLQITLEELNYIMLEELNYQSDITEIQINRTAKNFN